MWGSFVGFLVWLERFLERVIFRFFKTVWISGGMILRFRRLRIRLRLCRKIGRVKIRG